ncbi:hypothetical protein [Mesorhizobium sp.]|uniref:hypothetical protein n=1 Tax=Mesorhizobium sp. TaxID=1871066 RepID=UPI0025D24E42|nr:hypothetical protein [Mesorhizobium sp.]
MRTPAAAPWRARKEPIRQHAKQVRAGRSRGGRSRPTRRSAGPTPVITTAIVATIVTATIVIGERRSWSELAEPQLATRRLRIDEQYDGDPEKQQGFWSQPGVVAHRLPHIPAVADFQYREASGTIRQ